jgi:hypothetical protein
MTERRQKRAYGIEYIYEISGENAVCRAMRHEYHVPGDRRPWRR